MGFVLGLIRMCHGMSGVVEGVFCVRNGSGGGEKWTRVSPCLGHPEDVGVKQMLQLEHVLRQVQLLAGDLHHLLPVPRPHVLGRGPPNRSLVSAEL